MYAFPLVAKVNILVPSAARTNAAPAVSVQPSFLSTTRGHRLQEHAKLSFVELTNTAATA
jgi:hypothetical protein